MSDGDVSIGECGGTSGVSVWKYSRLGFEGGIHGHGEGEVDVIVIGICVDVSSGIVRRVDGHGLVEDVEAAYFFGETGMRIGL